MKAHPIAAIFPEMDSDAFEALKADIAAHGQREKITVYDGMILDGRNRFRACTELGKEPKVRDWPNGESPVDYVVSVNLHRRHLTSSQRAMVALDVEKLLAKEAKERKRASTKRASEVSSRLRELNRKADAGDEAADWEAYGLSREYRAERNGEEKQVYFLTTGTQIKIGNSVDPEQRLKQIQMQNPQAQMLGAIPGGPKVEHALHKRFAQWRQQGEWFEAVPELLLEISAIVDLCKVTQNDHYRRATAEAGLQLGVGFKYVSDAKKIATADPKLAAKVKAGDLTIPEAKRELKRQENAAKLSDWKASGGESKTATGSVNLILADPPWKYDFAETESRAIENQYASAGVEEIKRHIHDSKMPKVERDCVLLLWATAPKLLEAIAVMEAWGFTYKTHAVWDKQKIGMGYWFRGQHELLLVGTKGKASPPDDTSRVGSIFSEARGKHSAKPQCVYEWIERAFPMHRKLEMYCRSPREGWQVFGNEAGS